MLGTARSGDAGDGETPAEAKADKAPFSSKRKRIEVDADAGGIGLCGCDTEVKADGPRADKERLLDGDMDDEGRDEGDEEHDVEADNAAAAVGDASTLSVDMCLPTSLRSEWDCGDDFTD